ncbi:MAG: elongation factor G [Oscillospiraceae bacterium]|nr:elongation factor G [Oscillospiraceae bacterium]
MDYAPDKIRNVMLAGHSSSGKTSLTEALLFLTKTTDRLGAVADGNTVSDFDPEEIKRKTSISASVVPFDANGCHINLIDVPGLFDFELGSYEGIKAVETVLAVVSARSGAAVGTAKAVKLANKNNKGVMFYINKMATEHADFKKALESLKAEFSVALCPVVMPVVAEGKPTVYVDLLKMKAYTYADGKAAETAIPDTNGVMDEMLNELNEAVAETDEALMEKFFSGEKFSHEEITKGIRAGVKSGVLAPVVCGDSVALEGLDLVIDAIVHLLPSPAEVEYAAVDGDEKPVTLKADPSGPLVAYVFKTVADPFVGKLSYVKVLSGTLTADGAYVNATTGEQERPGKLLSVRGKKQTDVKSIVAGDIGAITKLPEAKTGDTLCLPGKVFKVSQIEFPHPSFSMAISAKKKGDESKVSMSMQKLLDEDRTIKYEVNSETGQQLLSGLGEQHLDVVVNKMRSKFGVEVDLIPPRVAYRETIRGKVKVQGRHKKQSGGHGQFGDVWIEFEPCDSDDMVFEENVFGGAVPKNFFPAVEKGLRECVKHGVVAGYPVVGLKATLVDGSYHPVDSSEMAFKTAASIAFKDGLPKASPVLLEPIGTLKAYVPDSNTGDVMGEVNKRRGRVLGMNPAEDGLQLVEAEVPMSEMTDFTTFMRSATQGRGHYSIEFARYDPLPEMLKQKVVDEAKELREAAEE